MLIIALDVVFVMIAIAAFAATAAYLGVCDTL